MSPNMGRPKNPNNRHLPPRMTSRTMKSGVTHYYYRTTDGGKLPLGSNLADAKLKWAQLESRGQILPNDQWAAVSTKYRTQVLPSKAPATQISYGIALDKLGEVFDTARLTQIKPMHIRGYLDARKAKVSANREIAIFSAVFNWARGLGITDCQNPVVGIKKHTEHAREVYVADEEFRALWNVAVPELQDALDIARLTGQRPADVIKMRRADISDGHLWVRQNKTGARIGIAVVEELAEIIERAKTRQRAATGLYLVQTDEGKRLTYTMLRDRFDAARLASKQQWQFRDLRSKAATDIDDLTAAKELLGHRSETTTAAIYRRMKGQKVQPVGRKKE